MDNKYTTNQQQQRDVVLSPNEYVFIQNNTNGVIKTYSGPQTVTISAQDSLVIFNSTTKEFEQCKNVNDAKQLHVSPPENWYCILKNPADKNIHPENGKPSAVPDLLIGQKINIKGPDSFALYPGQMAKVVRGHSLRTNQYLLARVYEANAASSSTGEILDTEGKKVNTKETYVNGQILVIKGTEVSFYIPPTGIEVIPIDNSTSKGYVREAVTLERLEYCILKDEDGNKRYIHGPKVVFPKATETFVTSPNGGYIFRAIELSKISGIYVKVIAEYTDDENVVHPVGEELFITGEDQMIYYPRPEHAIINYDGKLMHHAIAIPEGEGRYIMNRLTGEINTILGPSMYLPDPRTEVVVKRKLTENQCKLWYPGNDAVLFYNTNLTEKSVEKEISKNIRGVAATDAITAFSTCATSTTLASLEAKANISRGTSYTKPRTITLDNKYEGVVSIDVWTGYAINVISKNRDRKVICGPQTVLLDYDQSLETLTFSTGKPKTTDRTIQSVYLNYENNKVTDIIQVETKDFVRAAVKVSYCVNFDLDQKDKWFAVENYVKWLCDKERSIIKRKVKEYNIEEFYQKYTDIIQSVALQTFGENGMIVADCEVLDLNIEADIQEILEAHQKDMVQKSIELADAAKAVELTRALAESEQEQQALRTQQLLNKLELQEKEAIRKQEIQTGINRRNEAEKRAAKEAERDLQVVVDAIQDAEIQRRAKIHDEDMRIKREEADVEKAKLESYANTVNKIMGSIGPDLVASLSAKANADMLTTIGEALAPYALAKNESVSDVVNKLVRGTPLEEFVNGVNVNI